MKTAMLVAISVLGALLHPGFCGQVYAQTPYYQGKIIRLVQGRSPGGSGDIRSRAVAPFLTKYIPGNPKIVNEYMDGAGGRKAANFLFTTARPDGLTIGHVSSGIFTSAVLGESGIEYEIDKFHWLGSTDSAFHYAFFTRKELGLSNIEKLQAHSGLRIGATNMGHTTYTYGRTFAWLLGLKDPKFVLGYASVEVDVALAQGEVDARSNSTAEVVRRDPDVFKKGNVDFIAVLKIPREDKEPNFDHMRELDTFVKSERERRFLELTRATRSVGTPYLLPPGTPRELVQILRDAMKKTFQDPEFHKEFKKLTRDDPSPMMPETQAEVIRKVPRDKETIDLFKLVNGPNPLPPR